MEVIKKAFGDYQTNCYIVKIDEKEIIIDPGLGSSEWVKANVKNPIAILNTHGHFDHVWCNQELKESLNVPIYIPKDDAFMLENDIFGLGMPHSKGDFLVDHDESLEIIGIKVTFHHFPGHTPGCSVIEIDGVMFSGDFIFEGSIGRYDFPYSSSKDMKNSLLKLMRYQKDYVIYPGHGRATSLKEEKLRFHYWINNI